jgi:dTDP-4-dehydrorhamnose reductase
MRVAIIGSKGQLGSDLKKSFKGHEIISFDHDQIEVSDYASCQIIKESQADVVINTAAFHKTDACEDDPQKTFAVNAIGARNVTEVCREMDATVVYISTDFVFSGSKTSPYTEEDCPNPLNTYGISKVAGENYTKYAQKYYVLRVASLFGSAGASGKGGNFVETMITKARNNEEILVVDDMIMSPTYTKDAAEMMKQIVVNNLPFGIYHVTNSGYCSWYEFAGAIFEAVGWNVRLSPTKTHFFQSKAKRPLFSALKSIRLQKYGLAMQDWNQALHDYLLEKRYLSAER